MPQHRWLKWLRIKRPMKDCLRLLAAGSLVAMLFASGCSTTSQAPHFSQEPAVQASRPEAGAETRSPELAKQAEQRVVSEVDENTNIFFSLGSSSISPGEKAKLARAAAQLKEDKRLCVTLTGHANDNGSPSYNLAVADARIQSVSASLKKLGVRPQQIKKSVIGGEKTPSICRSQDCRRKMRRVELIISLPRCRATRM